MTRYEAIKVLHPEADAEDFGSLQGGGLSVVDRVVGDVYEAYEIACESMRRDFWIEREEKLPFMEAPWPEIGTTIIVLDKDYIMSTEEYSGELCEDIIAWMPIPQKRTKKRRKKSE